MEIRLLIHKSSNMQTAAHNKLNAYRQ